MICRGGIGLQPQSKHRLPRLVLLGVAGCTMQALFVAFIVLYVNFPADYDVVYGLSPASVPLFRTIWPYPTLQLGPDVFRVFAVMTILALWLVYGLAVHFCAAESSSYQGRRLTYLVVGLAVVFNATLAVGFPTVLSCDVYGYASYGRMISVYGLNPYATRLSELGGDPFVPLVHWPDVTSRYGPVWLLISTAAAQIGSGSVLATVVSLKVLSAASNLANCLLVYLLAKRVIGGAERSALLLYAWNPLILIETSGSGHNDGVMMTFALLGLLLVLKGRLLVGVAAVFLSVMVKYLTALLLVFIAARSFGSLGGGRQMARQAGQIAFTVLLVAALLYLPFLVGTESPWQLLSGWAPALNSLPNPLYLLIWQGVTALLGAGKDAAAVHVTRQYTSWGLQAAFLALLIVAMWRVFKGRREWVQVISLWGATSAVYVMVVYGGTYPWYLVPLLTMSFLAVPSPLGRRLTVWSIGLALGLMLLYALPIPK